MATDPRPPSPLLLKGPILLHEAGLPAILLIVALCIPRRSWATTSIFLPAILACHCRLLYTTSSNPSIGYAIGTYACMHTLLTLNVLIFSDPRSDFKRLTQPIYASVADANGSASSTTTPPKSLSEAPGESYPRDSLLRRIGWVCELTQVMRGLGWSWQIRPIPPIDKRELTSIRTFFRRRLVRLLLIGVYLDFLCWLMRDLDGAYFVPEGNAFQNPTTSTPLYPSLFGAPTKRQEFPPPKGFPEMPGEEQWMARALYKLALRVGRSVFAASAMYTTINAPYTILSVIAASLGCVFGLGGEGSWRGRWLDWRSWPDAFGSWSEGDWGHGIVGWWGTAWHGLFKNSFIAPGRFLIATLSLPRTHPAARLISLTAPFIISGALHFAGAFSQSGGGWGCVRFFLLQPLGITLEQVLIYLYNRLAPASIRNKRMEKVAAYAWTLVWFVLTSPSFFDEYRYGGVWCVEPTPVGVFRGMAGGGWWYWGVSDDGRRWWSWDKSLGGWGIRL